MEEQGKIDEIINNVKNYFRIQTELIRLGLASKVADAAASGVKMVVIGGGIFLSVIFLSLGLGFYFSTMLHSYTAGFFALGGVYLVITLLIFLLRAKLLEEPVKSRIIQKITEDKNDPIPENER